jgi:hypothetical protein
MAVTIESVEALDSNEIRCEYIKCISAMLSHSRSLLETIISANTDVCVTVGIVYAVLHRMIECAASILILAGQSRSRDMAVLLLNLVELRVDLQFIALKPERESEWLAHRNEWRKPWKIGTQLKEICSQPEELQAEMNMYHMFSMIKHGSPAKEVSFLREQVKSSSDCGGGVAFSITCDGNKLILDQKDLGYVTGSLLFGVGSNIHAGTGAASEILARRDLFFPSVVEDLAASSSALGKILERDLMRKMVQWVKTNDPKFDQLCQERERLAVELEEARKAQAELEAELKRLDELAEKRHSYKGKSEQ